MVGLPPFWTICIRHPNTLVTYSTEGDSTFAAISAVFAANVVLVAYIIQSVYEDKQQNEIREGVAKTNETKKKR